MNKTPNLTWRDTPILVERPRINWRAAALLAIWMAAALTAGMWLAR